MNMQCLEGCKYFPRECCARACGSRLHQTVQHEVLPLCSEDPTGAQRQKDQVKTWGGNRLNIDISRHNIVNINLKDKPDWFPEKIPLGQVPTLETSAGEVIRESTITCEYLDEAYPQKKLLPDTPFGKAQHKMLMENFSKIPPLTFKIVMGRQKGDDVSGLHSEMKDKFNNLKEDLVKKKSKFFSGNTVGMSDFMMWPWFERLEVFGLSDYFDDAPELKEWMKRMSEDPVVKGSGHSVDTYRAFFQNFKDGKPNYDYGL
ncbi:glutathione S-transferase omega-1-like isoform X2 [Phycodurus eques]|uniref:glutathione S-transferase omega-1-like isoform X2 n=1 Tax=Phycodurus eques TaxID=693459 RepID=UPI002ACD3280|nr:glutathione S-transferase omega-1-like isoform X2 [Phycodurus eques]